MVASRTVPQPSSPADECPPSQAVRTPMTAESKGRDLFIVDNSVSGLDRAPLPRGVVRHRQGLRHRHGLLRDRLPARARTASGRRSRRSGSSWAPRRRIARGRRCLRPSPTSAVEQLDDSIEADKDANPFLDGCARRFSRRCVRPDRVPRLRQGQVPRQGLHHARQARCRRVPGAGRVQQLHRTRA